MSVYDIWIAKVDISFLEIITDTGQKLRRKKQQKCTGKQLRLKLEMHATNRLKQLLKLIEQYTYVAAHVSYFVLFLCCFICLFNFLFYYLIYNE